MRFLLKIKDNGLSSKFLNKKIPTKGWINNNCTQKKTKK